MSKGRPPGKPAAMAIVETIEPSRDLNDEERDLWDRWVVVLRNTRPYLSTDGPMLTCVVDMEIRKIRAREALVEAGSNYVGNRRHPALTDCDNAHRDLMALLRELGLTAASAKNVKASPRSKEADQLTEFLKSTVTVTATEGNQNGQ